MNWMLWVGLAFYGSGIILMLFGITQQISRILHWQERQAKALERIAVAAEQWAFRYVRRKRKSEVALQETTPEKEQP